MQIYNTITMKFLTLDERLDILLTLKHTVKVPSLDESDDTPSGHHCFILGTRMPPDTGDHSID